VERYGCLCGSLTWSINTLGLLIMCYSAAQSRLDDCCALVICSTRSHPQKEQRFASGFFLPTSKHMRRSRRLQSCLLAFRGASLLPLFNEIWCQRSLWLQALDQVKRTGVISSITMYRERPKGSKSPVDRPRESDHKNVVPRVHVQNRLVGNSDAHRVDHARKQRCQCDEPRHKRSPVHAIRVPIDAAASLEEMGDVNAIATTDEVIVDHHDAGSCS
jgi:hypothetical protein